MTAGHKEGTCPMNMLTTTRGGTRSRSGGFFAAAIVPIVLVACSGATTTKQDSTGGTGDDGDSGVSTNPSPNPNPTPTPTPGSDAGSTASGSDSGSTAPPASDDAGYSTTFDASACTTGAATASEVVMIGDSYPALSGEIAKHLESLATAEGALASGSTYRTYYVSGTNLSGGTAPSIPAQFTEAVSANPDIKYVIMDGGGNDILLDNTACITTQPPPASANCVTVINNAVAAATTLFQTMKTAGVEKVIYYFYPHLPTTGKPYVNTTLDYAYPLVEAACASAAIPCYFVDTRPSFEGHTSYIGPDGIHPTTAGSDVIAGLIWGVMQQQCIAQ
jgi:hypothetical protein